MKEKITKITKIEKKINDAGGNIYLVGGAVRDEIMRKTDKR